MGLFVVCCSLLFELYVVIVGFFEVSDEAAGFVCDFESFIAACFVFFGCNTFSVINPVKS
jgi:hypothetical protein